MPYYKPIDKHRVCINKQTCTYVHTHTYLAIYATYEVHIFNYVVREAVSQTCKQLWTQLSKKSANNNVHVDSGTLPPLGGLMIAEIFWLLGKILEKSYVSAENIEKQALQWNILGALFIKFIKGLYIHVDKKWKKESYNESQSLEKETRKITMSNKEE